MGHVAVLARKGVGLSNSSFIIFVELILNKYYSPLSIHIREAFQSHWHSVGIGTDIIAVIIGKI